MQYLFIPKDHIYNKIIVEGKKKKVEINNNIIIVEDFNTPLIPMDRSTKQKINKETKTLNARIYNGEKTMSLKTRVGKTGQPLVKK